MLWKMSPFLVITRLPIPFDSFEPAFLGFFLEGTFWRSSSAASAASPFAEDFAGDFAAGDFFAPSELRFGGMIISLRLACLLLYAPYAVC